MVIRRNLDAYLTDEIRNTMRGENHHQPTEVYLFIHMYVSFETNFGTKQLKLEPKL
jgi:hypothetical protein